MVLIIGLAVGCRNDEAQNPSGGGGVSRSALNAGATFIPEGITARNVVADVEWKPGVVQVGDESFRTALSALSADERTYTFSKPVDGLTSAAPGTVAMVAGVGLLTVTSTKAEGSGFVMVAEPATLTTAIQNGKIEFDATVDVDHGARISSAKPPTAEPLPLEPAAPDKVSYEGERAAGGAGGPGGTGDETGPASPNDPAVGPASAGSDPLDATGARQRPGPDMTTVPPPSTPTSVAVQAPPNPDSSRPAYDTSTDPTPTTMPPDPVDPVDPGPSIAPAAYDPSASTPGAVLLGPAPGLSRVTSARLYAQPVPAPPTTAAPLTIGAAGIGSDAGAGSLPPGGLEGRAPLPEPASDGITGCTGPVCAIFGSAKSFDYVLDVSGGGGTTRLNYQMALKNESVGQIWIGGNAIIDKLDLHFAAEINDGALTSQSVSARGMKINGVLDFGARFSKTEAKETWLQNVHDRAAQVIGKDFGLRLETPDLESLTAAGETALAIQKLSNYYTKKWEELQKATTGTAGKVARVIGSHPDMLAGTDVVKIPLRIKVPVKVGPLTIAVSFGMDFAVVAAFSTNNSRAYGHFTFQASGDSGLEASSGSVRATDGNATIGGEWTQKPWAIHGVGSQGFSLTVAAPRIGIGTSIIGPIQGEAYLSVKNTVTQLTPGTIMPITGCALSKVWTSLEAGVVAGKDDQTQVARKELVKKGRWFQNPTGALCDQQVGS